MYLVIKSKAAKNCLSEPSYGILSLLPFKIKKIQDIATDIKGVKELCSILNKSKTPTSLFEYMTEEYISGQFKN